MLELDRDILANRYPLLPYQDRAVTSSAQFCWYCWSRQVGKSHGLGFKRVRRALRRKRLQVLLSAGERQSRELMQKVAAFCKILDALSDFRQDEFRSEDGKNTYKQLEIKLAPQFGGARIIGLPANPDTARGYTGDVFWDEAAIHKDDREIWASLYPTVTRGNGELDVSSTPKGLANVFASLRNNPEWEHSTVTIEDAVRQGLPLDVAKLKAGFGDEELWRQEFMCEFLDDSSCFLTYEDINSVMVDGLEPPVAVRGDDVGEAMALVEALAGDIDAVGWDIARRQDLSVIWLLKRIDGLLKTVGVIEMRDVPFRQQQKLLHAVMQSGAGRVCIDATGIGMALAEAAVEDFGTSRVEPVMFTLATKQELAEPLRVKVQDKNIHVPCTDAIRNDWHSVQRSVTGDRIRYKSERTKDGHADRFWAAALAVRAAAQAAGPAEYMGSEQKLAFARKGIW